MENNTWQLQDAKSKFSQLVDKAMLHQPQIVTKRGHEAVVVLSFEDYKKMTKPDSDLVSFFRNSPFFDTDLDLRRNKDLPREMDL
jgi:prevent-host-death family protein